MTIGGHNYSWNSAKATRFTGVCVCVCVCVMKFIYWGRTHNGWGKFWILTLQIG